MTDWNKTIHSRILDLRAARRSLGFKQLLLGRPLDPSVCWNRRSVKPPPFKSKSNPPSRMRLMAPALRVLLVDDEPTVLRAVKRGFAMRRPNWNILSVSSPIEAMVRLETETFDIVISDFEMPQLNGVELMKLVKRKQPEALRLILSGLPRQRAGFIPVGLVHGWISKLCDSEELLQQCEDMLVKRAQRKARTKAG
jgi:response regulator RpfG family c-di-GMP phosphodiesterase